MAYFIQSDLEALIPAAWLVEGLDDDANGAQDAFTVVQTAAEDEVNGALGIRYSVPLDTTGKAGLESFLRSLCAHIAAEMIYGRRGQTERFPFEAKLKAMRAQLAKMAAGELPLSPEVQRETAAIVAITEDSRIHSTRANV
jgi:phage gp36-like protein